MKRKFLYQKITDDIRKKIISQYYKDGDVLEKSADLMKRYNASIITINKALGLLADQGYIRRIPGTGSIVQYSGQQMEMKNSMQNIIGAIVVDIAQSDMWSGVLKAIEDYLFPQQYQLIFGNNFGESNRILDYIDQFYKQRVKGIVYVPLSAKDEATFYDINNKVIDRIEQYGLKYIILHNILRKGKTIQVGFDNYHDSCLLTNALWQEGCRFPLLLSYELYNSVVDERERGFVDTLLRQGVKNPENFIVRLPLGSRTSEPDYDFLKTLDGILSRNCNVDAILAVDEYYLKLLHKAVQSNQCCINPNVMVSGFGKVEEIIDTNSIAMYQRQNPSTLGRIAIENLMSLINNGRQNANHIIRVPSELMKSGTVTHSSNDKILRNK